MYKNNIGRKENATFLLGGAVFLVLLSPIWLVILIGLFFPLLVAGFLGWAIVGLIYKSIVPERKTQYSITTTRRK